MYIVPKIIVANVRGNLIALFIFLVSDVVVDKKKIGLNDAIKTLGVYTIDIKLFEGITGKLKVTVVSE